MAHFTFLHVMSMSVDYVECCINKLLLRLCICLFVYYSQRAVFASPLSAFSFCSFFFLLLFICVHLSNTIPRKTWTTLVFFPRPPKKSSLSLTSWQVSWNSGKSIRCTVHCKTSCDSLAFKCTDKQLLDIKTPSRRCDSVL